MGTRTTLRRGWASWANRSLTVAAPIAAAIAGGAAVVIACTNAGKHEAASLVDAVDRFRRADNAAKPGLAPGVDGVSCSATDVCEAKRLCTAAIDPTARALAIKNEVELRYGDIQRGALDPHSPEATALPGKLDEATKLLEEGKTKMPDCERKLTDLKVQYRI